MNIKWHGTQFVPSVSNGFPIDVFMGSLKRIFTIWILKKLLMIVNLDLFS